VEADDKESDLESKPCTLCFLSSFTSFGGSQLSRTVAFTITLPLLMANKVLFSSSSSYSSSSSSTSTENDPIKNPLHVLNALTAEPA